MREPLTKAQAKFLRKLSPEPDTYRSVRYEDVGLSFKGYRDLFARGLIIEAWNWLTTTRPQVALSDAGRAAILALDATPSSLSRRENGR